MPQYVRAPPDFAERAVPLLETVRTHNERIVAVLNALYAGQGVDEAKAAAWTSMRDCLARLQEAATGPDASPWYRPFAEATLGNVMATTFACQIKKRVDDETHAATLVAVFRQRAHVDEMIQHWKGYGTNPDPGRFDPANAEVA